MLDSVNHLFRIERLADVDVDLPMVDSNSRQDLYNSSK